MLTLTWFILDSTSMEITQYIFDIKLIAINLNSTLSFTICFLGAFIGPVCFFLWSICNLGCLSSVHYCSIDLSLGSNCQRRSKDLNDSPGGSLVFVYFCFDMWKWRLGAFTFLRLCSCCLVLLWSLSAQICCWAIFLNFDLRPKCLRHFGQEFNFAYTDFFESSIHRYTPSDNILFVLRPFCRCSGPFRPSKIIAGFCICFWFILGAA